MEFELEKQTLAESLFAVFSGRGLLFDQHDGERVMQLEDGFGGDDGNDGDNGSGKKKQGTFMGVYLPIVASMWGVIIFIRFGVVVAYVGWTLAIVFVFLSAFVQVLTTLSLCAIISNSTNYGGGIFGILKRNLGAEIAGVVGLLNYLGLTTLASIELLGSIQAINYILANTKTYEGDSLTGSTYLDQIAIGIPLLFVLVFIRAIDVRGVHFMTALILCVVIMSFVFGFTGLFLTLGDWRGTVGDLPGVTGLNMTTFMNNKHQDFTPPDFTAEELKEYGVTTVMVEENSISSPSSALGLIFPMFIGIFQGANKASELKTPNRSIFKGTLFAILTSTVVYIAFFLLLSAVAERMTLKVEFLLFNSLTWPTEYIGLVGTILVGIGACVELLEIGPLVLRDVANGEVFSFLQTLGLHKTSKNGEPVNAVLVSFSINLCLLFVTSQYFETLAQVVSMFMMQAYFMVHFALLLNEFQQHASWRPAFRYYHWTTALLGCISTIVLMFYIQWVQAVITFSLMILLLFMVRVIEEPRRKGLGTHKYMMGNALKFLVTDDNITHRLMKKRVDAELHPGQADSEDGHHDEEEFPHWEPQVMCLLNDVRNRQEKEVAHRKLLHFTEQLTGRGLHPQLAIVGSLINQEEERVRMNTVNSVQCSSPSCSRSRPSTPGVPSSGNVAPRGHCCKDDFCKNNHIGENILQAKTEIELGLFSLAMSVNLRAFPQAVVAPANCSVSDGYLIMMQTVGLGGLKPNLVLVGMTNTNLVDIIRHANISEKVICVLKDEKPLEYRYKSRKLRRKSTLKSSSSQSAIIDSGMNGSPEETREETQGRTEHIIEMDLKAGSVESDDDDDDDDDENGVVGVDREEEEEQEQDDFSDDDSSNADEEGEGEEEDYEHFEDQVIYDSKSMNKILHNKWRRRKRAKLKTRSGTIDVWWIVKNGGLPVLLARILKSHRIWKSCKIRVFAIVEGKDVNDALTVHASLEVKKLLSQMRVKAAVEVIQIDGTTQNVVRDTIFDEDGDLEDLSCASPNVNSTSTKSLPEFQHRVQMQNERELQLGHDDDIILHCKTQPSFLEVAGRGGGGNDSDPDTEKEFIFQAQRRRHRSVLDVFLHNNVEEFNQLLDDKEQEQLHVMEEQEHQIRERAIRTYQSLLERYSCDAELVILNLPRPENCDNSETYRQQLMDMTVGIDRVLFLLASLDDHQMQKIVH